MNYDLKFTDNIIFLKDFFKYLFFRKYFYILVPLFLTILSIFLFHSYFKTTKFIYKANIHPNVQILPILEIRNDISNGKLQNLDFNKYLSSTINRFFNSKQYLYDALVKYQLINFDSLIHLNSPTSIEELKYINEFDKLRSIFTINPKKLAPVSDTLPTNAGNVTQLHDYEIEIISKYKLDYEYLFTKIIEAKIIYNVEALSKFVNLYKKYINNLIETAESTKKLKILEEINALETALLVTEITDPETEIPVDYIFRDLLGINTASDQTVFLNVSDIEKLLVYKKSILEKSNFINNNNLNAIAFKNIRERIEDSFYINEIENINKEDQSILLLFRDLFYTSDISATSRYNNYLLSVLVFLNLLIFFISIFLVYISFITKDNPK